MSTKFFFNRAGNLQLLLLPILSMCAIFIPIALLRPIVVKYMGLQLLLNMAIPLSFVTLGQMFAMAIGEIDFSIGNLVSLVTCIIGAILPRNIALGVGMLLGIVVIYMVIGAFLHLRKLSSIVVTIGMSFVWTGLAVIIQPSPGSTIPAFLQSAVALRTPAVPLPIIFLIVLALAGHLVLFKTNFGILVRGIGGNVKAIHQAGHSIVITEAAVFGLVGLLAILSGASLAGLTTSSDANVASNYTLLSVAGVMLGGGSFPAGRSPQSERCWEPAR